MSNPPESPRRILALGAHPDDIEFGCGGILLLAQKEGATLQMVVCSRGEAGTNGTPEIRQGESEAAAAQLGASLQFLELGGDGHLAASPAKAIEVARVIREFRPHLLIAPTTVANQHPDHVAVGTMARDAARLARFGGLAELASLEPWAIENLLHYAVAPSAEPAGPHGLWFDISNETGEWKALMGCHASQLQTRRYLDLQVARARARGLEAGVEAVQVLFPNEPFLLGALTDLPKGVRLF